MEEIKKCLEEFPYCYQKTVLEDLVNNNELYKAQQLAYKFSNETNDDELFEHIEELREAIRNYKPPPTFQKTPKCDKCNKKKNVKWKKEPFLNELYNIHKWIWICIDCYRQSCEDI